MTAQGTGNGTSPAPPDTTAAMDIENGHSAPGTASAAGTTIKSFARTNPSSAGTRFHGLAGIVEESIASSIERNLGNVTAPFPISTLDLSNLSNDRTRASLADVVERGILNLTKSKTKEEALDEEMPPKYKKLQADVLKLVESIRAAGEHDADATLAHQSEADKNTDLAANIITSVLLRSSPESGIDPREVEYRRQIFGTNAIAEKKLDSFLKLMWDAVQDFVLIMLIVLGIIIIIVELTTHEGPCTTCWIEGTAILVAVLVVVLVTASIDYAKQKSFVRLTRNLLQTNTKAVIRDAMQVSVTDDDIVVGDILSVNSHNLASIPADCILLGPATDLKMDESSLTGESHLVSKRPGDIILSGTNTVQGNGKMVVIAVGINSVAGKIKARVYESEDHDDDLEGEDSNSPLFVKLDSVAKRIGIGGTIAGSLSFIVSCIIGLGVKNDPPSEVVEYLITAITVLAVAVPEGLPLAVTLALAFSSNKMMKEQNLVKHLDACETMGCATTICTDKTGTLTANNMTCRAIWTADKNCVPTDPSVTLGDYLTSLGLPDAAIEKICNCISINTMNESVLYEAQDGTETVGAAGNPTEVALLHLVRELGRSYEQIRNTTRGRSDQGSLGEFLAEGKQFGFSSARKMMSWAVPIDGDRYRLYCKGAQEVVTARCSNFIGPLGEDIPLDDDKKDEIKEVGLAYARRGMRCLALAYRDLPAGFDLEATSGSITNSDGSPGYEAETELTAIALVGIEDPLRPEVPGAIEKCYQAGIDVRLVTGDNPNTAVSIAHQAGILRELHFKEGSSERVASNLKENVLMEGKDFRQKVYRDVVVDDGTKKEFDQAAFDKIWPHLRVLARSSPDDKLTLAHGLNQSNLFADKELCKHLLKDEGISVFPDRQVIAMTGDGTNDAPALKRADIGFAMGIAGTQIAKDAADIILLDDNFASIVTAVKWGRNVYAAIQKFLQFQLTVNISAVVTALVGSFAYQQSPLAAIQLLWVNLLVDSLASLALASEPPTEELLQKPPVNRTDSMITKHMIANMVGQACYQITVVMTLLFAGPELLGITPGNEVQGNSVHYTLIFNSFVWMQLFNEVNSRKLKGEFNVFEGILNNRMFCGILISTSILQALIVQFGTYAFAVAPGGLSAEYWGLSIMFGFISLPVQQVINVLYRLGQRAKNVHRNQRRIAKQGHATTRGVRQNVVSHPHTE